MRGFDFLEPKSLKEACSLLAKHKNKANILAGGQSLVVLLKTGALTPDYIINIKNLKEMDYIRDTGDSVKIGALTTHRNLETSGLIEKRFPVLVEAEHKLAHRQVRNWGTVGGDLCHADPAADISPPLIALGAIARAVSARGEREIPLNLFFIDYFTTALEDDEILTEIEVPYPPAYSGAAYRKETVISGDYPIVSVAAAITLDSQRKVIQDACIVLGAVGTTPVIANKAVKALKSKPADGGAAEAAAALAIKEAEPVSDILGSEEYKRKILSVLTVEIVNRAIERARENSGGGKK